MKRLRLFLIPVVAIAFALTAYAAPKQKPTRPKAAQSEAACIYKGYIVLDAASGNVLLEDNPNVVSPPASMTKLMTFAVLSDRLQSGALTLDTPVKIDASDAGMGGTQVYLDTRETFSVEELIYAMMIQSANDAAHALARISAGSVPIFVEQMNAKAHEIGMTHTIFRTPHGLTSERQSINEGDLTTPRDFALLCRYLVLKTDVLKYSSIRERDFAPNRPKGPQHMENHNRLIGRVIGVDGLKTGYTKNAGYCLSATAERNGHRLVAVIMGCFGPKGEIDKGVARDRKMIELLERGFAGMPAGAGPATTVPTAAAPKPTTTSKAPANRPAQTAPIAAPAIQANPAPQPVSPVSSADTEVSPVQAAGNPVSTATESTDAAAPSVKFELPKKTPATKK
jgi:D-alanyl-D-alanine carboxypeptidase (penicillin-binding protein 5/6)